MENLLEVVLLDFSDIQKQKNLLNREDSFTISKSPSGEYLELIVPGGPTAFMTDTYNPSGIPGNFSGINSEKYKSKLCKTFMMLLMTIMKPLYLLEINWSHL